MENSSMEAEKLNISVLFVEDEHVLRKVYGRMISNLVDQLYIAENGQEGLDMYREHQPDLVITDIKMPVMTGLDMTALIKRDYPAARIILLSAFGESNFFLRAIDLGVKNYLLKPVEYQKIVKVIEDQAKEILLEKQVQVEEEKRLQAEQNLFQNEQILQAVSEIADRLFRHGYSANTINFALKRLGEATKVSRVYIFETYDENGCSYSQQTYEWVAEGIAPQINNEQLISIPNDEGPFKRWASLLRNGFIVSGAVKDMPENEQEILLPQDIISVLVVPIFVQSRWFGFLGFDDCHVNRHWSVAETNTIVTAGSIMGSAIQRDMMDAQLRKLNHELEERVLQRTRKLEAEVTERRNIEKMLRASEEKYRLIFENANDGIFLEVNQRIQFINPRFYELTGYFPNQLIGRLFTDIVDPESEPLVEKVNSLVSTGTTVPESIDIRIITSKAEKRWVEMRSEIIQWDNEPAVITFLTDINARKKYEQDLKELNLTLEARVLKELKHREKQQQMILHKTRLESLGELAAGIAHEINQPVGGISMSLDNIVDELESDRFSINYLKTKINLMFADIERIRNIINHVRLFAREQDNVVSNPFAISDLFNNTRMLVNRMYANQGIEFSIGEPPAEAIALGNVMRMEQVMLNLLSNARHAVEQRKKQADPDYVKKISMTCRIINSEILIYVEDNGSGIPERQLNNIFDPFFSTKRNDEGTGLGLSISYGIIHEMGGKIEVESQVDVFTRMIISLPLIHQNTWKN